MSPKPKMRQIFRWGPRGILGFFVQGLLLIIPAAVTIYVLWLMVKLLSLPLQWAIVKQGEQATPLILALGVVLSLLLILLVGFFASFFITRPVVQFLDNLFNRLPLVKLLYSSIKDLTQAFMGEEKRFNQPVLVNLTRDGAAHALGFVTRESLDFMGLPDLVAVYLPQSYNFAGMTLLFPRDQVTVLNLDSADVMTFIVSGGVSFRQKPE